MCIISCASVETKSQKNWSDPVTKLKMMKMMETTFNNTINLRTLLDAIAIVMFMQLIS